MKQAPGPQRRDGWYADCDEHGRWKAVLFILGKPAWYVTITMNAGDDVERMRKRCEGLAARLNVLYGYHHSQE